MRKTRNSFFNEPNFSTPTPPSIPYQAATNYNSFYSGPGVESDIQSRLAKIERQVNRLEHRVNKLEATSSNYVDADIDANNMYML